MSTPFPDRKQKGNATDIDRNPLHHCRVTENLNRAVQCVYPPIKLLTWSRHKITPMTYLRFQNHGLKPLNSRKTR